MVTNRFSNWASVIDTASDEVVGEIPVPFYTIDVAFLPDGSRAYLTNRWKDSVLRWDLEVDETHFEVTGTNYAHVPSTSRPGSRWDTIPGTWRCRQTGTRLYVAAVAGLSVSIIDTATDLELERVDLNAPPGDVLVAESWVLVTHTGSGTHHPPDEGFDTNGDGMPGDGTANVMFQDLQNEIAVLTREGDPRHNYTSDTICCVDYRDVDPDEPDRGLSLPSPDTWPPERVAYLPPAETWSVACALPEQMAVTPDRRVLVVCSGSNEVQTFDLATDGSLTPRETAGGLFRTGMHPAGVLVSGDGTKAYVAEHLGEHVTVLDLVAGPGAERRILVGDVTDGEFPATDAEMGRPSTSSPPASAWTAIRPVCTATGRGATWPSRWPCRCRPTRCGACGCRWRIAAPSTPAVVLRVLHGRDELLPGHQRVRPQRELLLRPAGSPHLVALSLLETCLADGTVAGCNHVLNCTSDPPPECAARGYGSEHLLRGDHFRAAAMALFGTDRTLGDALFEEIIQPDGSTERRGILLDFDGVTRAIGLFLMTEPRLLPSPWAHLDLPAARRGAHHLRVAGDRLRHLSSPAGHGRVRRLQPVRRSAAIPAAGDAPADPRR